MAKLRPAIPWRAWGRGLLRAARELIRRAYAVGVIVLTAWLSFLALRYLIVTLILPTPTPAQITGIPTRLDDQALRTPRSAWLGVAASESPRAPLAHYHRLGGWLQPDQANDCTRSGCHAPLPHARRPEVRAFLNMHATTIHCGICHMQTDSRSLATTWYDPRTGQPRDAPAILQAFDLLSSPARRPAASEPAAHDRLVRLLHAAARDADNPPDLAQLAAHLDAVRPGSPAAAQLLDAARDLLPRHFRGEYGAKLALRDRATGAPLLAHPGTAAAVEHYLRAAGSAEPARRAELLAAVHPLRRAAPLHCTDCHRPADPLLDFAAAGYPPARIDMLSRAVIFRMIEQIAAGQPFYLPGFVPTGDRPPADGSNPPPEP